MVKCTILSALNFFFLSIIYGSAFAATDQGIKYHSPAMMQVYRMVFGFGLSALICVGRLLFQKGYRAIFISHFKHGVMPFVHLTIGGFMNIGISHCLVAIAQQWISSSFLQVLQPFSTAAGAITGHFLLADEKLTCIKSVSIILSFVGTIIASVPNFLNSEENNVSTGNMALGFVLAIIAMAMFGIAPVYFKWTNSEADVTVSACVQTSTSAVVCFIYAIIEDGITSIHEKARDAPPIAWLWPILTGCLSSGLGVHMFMILLNQLGAFGSNFIPFGQLIVGVVIGIAILGEWDTYKWWMILLNILGILILIGAMSIGFYNPKKNEQDQEAAEDEESSAIQEL